MLTPSSPQRGTDPELLAVDDPATGAWTTPTAGDIEVWERYPSILGEEGI